MLRRCFCVARFALPLNSTHTHTHHPPQRQKLGEHEVIEAFDAALLGDSGGVPPMREGGRRRNDQKRRQDGAAKQIHTAIHAGTIGETIADIIAL